uniref:Uncharacterized protein n=1 Tax=Arundo donax TaxID=35708 RepID=A0A0A8YKS6_ARUDO
MLGQVIYIVFNQFNCTLLMLFLKSQGIVLFSSIAAMLRLSVPRSRLTLCWESRRSVSITELLSCEY